MIRFAIFFISLLLFNSLSAQTSRMNNAATGRNYSVEHRGQTIMPLLQEAERNYRSFQYEGTLFKLEEAVNQNPYSAEALLLRARFKKRMGMLAEAEADYKRANLINPYVTNLYGYNGTRDLLNILSFTPAESMTSLNSFQKLDYYFPLLDNRTMANQQEIAETILLDNVVLSIQAETLEEALQQVDTILNMYPESAIAFDLKGLILMKQGKYNDATISFSKAVALEPSFAIAWYNFAQVERKLGNLDKAKAYLDKAISLQADLTKAYFERASVLKSMGEKEDALADYNTVIALKGEQYMEAFLNRGLTKKMLGDYGGAMSDLNKAIEEFPDNSELIKNRGNVHMLFGFPLKAIDDYTKAIQLDGAYAEAYYNRALAHLQNYDRISGCYDMEKSAMLGFEKAQEMLPYFCGE
jgi:tetratricopeptide (TPR) repeat protein